MTPKATGKRKPVIQGITPMEPIKLVADHIKARSAKPLDEILGAVKNLVTVNAAGNLDLANIGYAVRNLGIGIMVIVGLLFGTIIMLSVHMKP